MNCDIECFLYGTNTCSVENENGKCHREFKPKNSHDDAGAVIR